MDKIKLHNIDVLAFIGVPDEERAKQQPLSLDVTVHLRLDDVGASDDIDDTVNYANILKTVHKVFETPCKTIEFKAIAVANAILTEHSVNQVDVNLRKPNALRSKGVEYAAVEVSRWAP